MKTDKRQKRLVKNLIRLLKAVYKSEDRAGYNYDLRTAFVTFLTEFQKDYPTIMINSMFYEIVDNLPDS